MVEGRTARRVHRLQPECKRSHCGRGVLRPSETGPADFTMATMPARFKAIGDRHAQIDEHPCSLDALLELSARHEKEGLGDAPWPPQYRKQPGEPRRVQPSRAREANPSRTVATGRR